MKINNKTHRIIFIIGIIALIIGTLDPMEGSVLILVGSGLLALSTFLSKNKYYKIFLVALLLIVAGVFSLFYLSSLGGFGGSSKLSWWYGLFILPYPVGWLIDMVTLLIILVQNKKKKYASN